MALSLGATVSADESESPVSIRMLNPRAGRLQLVTGTVSAAGVPVVLVRSDAPNEPWWVQGKAVPTGARGFSSKAVFGSAITRPGAKFRVITILVDPAKTQYSTGQVLKELPDVPMSDQLFIPVVKTGNPHVSIVRADTEEPTEQPRLAEITLPRTGSDVPRITEVKGKIQEPYHPVVLVRPLADKSAWYVQKTPKLNDDGKFSLKIVFGNSRTAQGRRFRVIALALPSKEAAIRLKPGTVIRKLPDSEGVSKEVVVTLRELSPKRNDSQAAVPTTRDVR